MNFNWFKNHKALMPVFLFCLIAFPRLLSFDHAWMHPEQFYMKSFILENGHSFVMDDFRRSLDWKHFEYEPRLSRPISSLFEIVDTKFRCWLWQFMLPVPSLSLVWVLVFLVSPWLLFLLFKRLGISLNVAVLGIFFYLLTPVVLSHVVMLSRPSKALINVAMIACFYLASSGRFWLLWTLMLLSMFIDETGILIYLATLILFPQCLDRQRRWMMLSLPVAAAIIYKFILPYLTIVAGYGTVPTGSYLPVQLLRFDTFFSMEMWSTLFLHAKLLFLETLGIVPVDASASLGIKLLGLVTVLILGATVIWMVYQKALRQTSRLWIVLGLFIIAHNVLIRLTINYCWGPYYYGSFWSVVFVILLVKAVDRIKINTWILSCCFLIIGFQQVVGFIGTNEFQKKWHYYPYAPYKIRETYLDRSLRFSPSLRLPFSGRLLKSETELFWGEVRGHIKNKNWRLPKELTWLPIELEGYKFTYKSFYEIDKKLYLSP